jgi:beta-glucosidase
MRKQNAATNQLLAGLADGKKVIFKDIGNSFLQSDGNLPKDIMPDLLHLNAKGYQMWAEAIEPIVKQLMK